MGKIINRTLSVITAFLLLFYQSLFPILALAQEAVSEPSPTPVATAQPTSEPIPSEIPQPSNEPTPDESPLPPDSPEPTPILKIDENITSPIASESAVIDTSHTESQSSAQLTPSVWQTNADGSVTTTNNVVLNQTYIAPQNDKVSVTFTKLPENPGKLSVKEIKLTSEQIAETGALTDTAYEITSDMTDGTFEYTLTLPTPGTENVEVKISEDGGNFTPVDGESVSGDVVTIAGLNHFTIFVVVGTIDFGDNEVTEEFDESESQVLINEFVYNPSSGNEWIELYNTTGEEVDLSSWQLCELTGSRRENCTSVTNSSLSPNGFVVEEFSSARLNNSGDTINLRDDEGELISQVSYDSASDVDDAIDVGNVAQGQSVGRIGDGDETWDSFPQPTKGTSNQGTLFVDQDFDGDEYGTFNHPFTSIQAALDRVLEGGTVNVAPGEYEENLEIETSLTLIGDPGDDAVGPGEDAPTFYGDCNGDPVISIEANNVTVSGFIIIEDGCDNSNIYIDGSTNDAVIFDNDLNEASYYGVEIGSGSSDNLILKNLIHDNGDYGIYNSGPTTIITNNEIYNNNGGIGMGGDGNVSGTQITNNKIYENYNSGIYIGGVSFSKLIISDNISISSNEGYGIYFDAVTEAVLTISGNSITNNNYDGIYIGEADEESVVNISGNTITNNVVDNGYAGVYVNNVYDSIVSIKDNAEISNNSGQGIYICAEGECENSTIIISGNNVEGNTSEGISIYRLRSSILTVKNNKISSNRDTGFELKYIGMNGESEDDPSAASILGNTIGGVDSGNGNYGIYIGETDSESTVTIGTTDEGEDNIISDNTNAGIYLAFGVTGVSITGNTIENNGTISERTGIVVNSAPGNQAHENTISGNGSVGVNNQDSENEFDATKNYWGAASGPLHESTNPNGQGNSVSDRVLYKPFYVNSNLTTLSEGTIVIIKDSDPNDSQDFTFTRSFGANFSLDDDANDTLSNTVTFPSVATGVHTVTENSVNGWNTTGITCNDPNGDSATSTTERTATIDLDAGETITCTFTNTKLGSISGTKFEDDNGNGTKDSSDSGKSGWIIQLSDNASSSVTTDSNGNYSFANLAPGTYRVCETSQSGWTQTAPSAGYDCGSGLKGYEITLSAGQNLTGKDFGNFNYGQISGKKYNDVNASGEDETGELGLSGWTIYIDSNNNGQLDLGETTATTDSTGHYTFSNLGPGTYVIREVQQNGWTRTDPTSTDSSIGGQSDGSYSVTMTSNGNKTQRNFGNFQLGTISGNKFNDLNGNGSKDSGETGLSGWTIFLDTNNNGTKDNGETSTTTDSDGNYSFSNVLTSGTYKVREVLQGGWVQTTINPSDITVTSGTTQAGVDFGNFQKVTISGKKFSDLNGNAIKESTESGKLGWIVFLDTNNNGILDTGETSTTTGSDGSYSFPSLGPGTYKVREATQSGWTRTTTNPSDITVTSGTNVTGIDFGNFPWAIITGTKWKDLDADGVFDKSEPGIGGWDIDLSSVTTSTSLAVGTNTTLPIEIVQLQLTSQTATPSGQFSLQATRPGTYRITEHSKDGFQRTFPVDSFFDVFVDLGGQTITKDKNNQPLKFGNAPFVQPVGEVKFVPSGDATSSASLVVLGSSTISVSNNGGTSTVSLPDGTVITRTDGSTIDSSLLSAQDIATSSLSGLGSGVVADGTMQWGIPNIGLTFNPAITLNIFVGTALNGQTLNVVRSVDGVTWTQDGIETPKTCTVGAVTSGICTFKATKASYYAATHTTTATTTSGTTQATTTPSGPFAAPTCSDAKPESAPTLLSASGGTNSVTLTWSKAANPVTYYLATYGLSSGSQQYGNPNIGGADSTSYTVSNLSGGTTYYFKVRAGNGCAPGDFSNEVSATPGGGFIEGPAAGFAPGVLGSATQEGGNIGIGDEKSTESVSGTSTGMEPGATLGKQTETKPSGRNWFLIISVLTLGASAGYFIFRKFLRL